MGVCEAYTFYLKRNCSRRSSEGSLCGGEIPHLTAAHSGPRIRTWVFRLSGARSGGGRLWGAGGASEIISREGVNAGWKLAHLAD